MRANRRHDAVRVRGGRTQKKNNWKLDRADYNAVPQDEIRLYRRHPGPGHRHVLTIAQLREFLPLLPDWHEVAIGLDAIVLDQGDAGTDGWCWPGVVALCARARDLWEHDISRWYVEDHREVFDLIGLERRQAGGQIQLRWTEAQLRAFLLVHVLPHELGHHHDRMTNRSQYYLARGEPYAEDYANRALDHIWPRYIERFEL